MFIFGARNNIHIIDLAQTVPLLHQALVQVSDVVLEDLPPRPRGTPIEVVYRYTVNQTLEVDVTDVETRTTRRATIHIRGSLSAGELGEATQRLAAAAVR